MPTMKEGAGHETTPPLIMACMQLRVQTLNKEKTLIIIAGMPEVLIMYTIACPSMYGEFQN
jgi:hypothetical protein